MQTERKTYNMFEALPILHEARKQHCGCGRIMVTPQFHDPECPYRVKGAELMPGERN